MGSLDGVQILSLNVLDQRDFEEPIVGDLLDDDWYGFKAGKLSSSPAPFAGDKLVAATARPDDDWLDDSIGANGVGEFLHALGLEHPARLDGIGIDLLNSDVTRCFRHRRRLSAGASRD